MPETDPVKVRRHLRNLQPRPGSFVGVRQVNPKAASGDELRRIEGEIRAAGYEIVDAETLLRGLNAKRANKEAEVNVG